MPEASFYILSSQSLQARYLFACKLIEKAYRCGQFGFVCTDTPLQSQQLDNQLWMFRKNSFIPHQIYDETDNKLPEYQQTILIGTKTVPKNWQKLIINLSLNYPNHLTHTERVLEIIDNTETSKQAGRQRFNQYKKNGFSTTVQQIQKK